MTAVMAASKRFALAALLQRFNSRVFVRVMSVLVRMLVTGLSARHTVGVEGVYRGNRGWARDSFLAATLALANVDILSRARADFPARGDVCLGLCPRVSG